jgi:hypothetical protein
MTAALQRVRPQGVTGARTAAVIAGEHTVITSRLIAECERMAFSSGEPTALVHDRPCLLTARGACAQVGTSLNSVRHD